jgi:hypothetical protein
VDASTTRSRSAIAFRTMAIAEPPPQILDLASACLEYVDRALGFTLDFSSDTLGVVDHYATTVRANLATNPSLGPLIGPAVGAYFGEVVRVRFHGFWRVPPNQHDWAVCLRTVFLNINPIGVGYDALYGSTDHDGPRSALRVAPEDREFLDRRLETLPPVPEDQYHLLTTRFEVLEVAAESLRAKMEEEGYGGTEYTEEDYLLDYG